MTGTARATAADLRRLALQCDGAVESSHMQHPDFRANGRVFATLQPDGLHAMVKLTPPQQDQWLADMPDAARPASGAWGRQGCTLIELGKLTRSDVAELVTTAWQNAMAAKPGRSQPRKAAGARPGGTAKKAAKK